MKINYVEYHIQQVLLPSECQQDIMEFSLKCIQLETPTQTHLWYQVAL